jgi:phytoene desaturase
MASEHVIIIGGGVAGLSAGCYALANGFDVTIVEHNLALGGVCTAWRRGDYVIDGCIHWLAGGPFARLYDELGIAAAVELRPIDHLTTYRDLSTGVEFDVTRDLDALGRALAEVAPKDAKEVWRIVEGAEKADSAGPPFEPQELATPLDALGALWQARHQLGTIAHFHQSVGVWAADHLESERLRRFFTRLLPEQAPALFLLFMLGQLGRGQLTRPVGGTARFRDALVGTYQRLGGTVKLYATVDEVLVEGHRVRGVRLADGTMLEADAVVSTASAPETILRLLGGRYGGDELGKRLGKWKLFDPIVLASYGVGVRPATDASFLLLDRVGPIKVGDREIDHLYVRLDADPASAPAGHCVVQVMAETDYDWWATRGAHYVAEKDLVGNAIWRELEHHMPEVRGAARAVDVSTPLTYWAMARSWRGAYEGWLPTPDSFFGHIRKTLPGLGRFYMAGQWVEPGGGVPTAMLSGRQAIQLLCADYGQPFVAPRASPGLAPVDASAP